MRYLDAMPRQYVFQAMQRQMRCPPEVFDDESPMRLKNPLTMTAHFARRNAPRRPMTL